MARRSKLENDFEHLDGFIGISYHLRDYRLVYDINKSLGLALIKADDLPVFNTRTQGISEYSCYTSTDTESLLTYFLISNSGNDGLMLPQQKLADFFLLIKGAGGIGMERNLVDKIKDLPNVLTAFTIDQEKTANIDILISELELHELSIKKNSRDRNPEDESLDNL
jgi:hypothetical protein